MQTSIHKTEDWRLPNDSAVPGGSPVERAQVARFSSFANAHPVDSFTKYRGGNNVSNMSPIHQLPAAFCAPIVFVSRGQFHSPIRGSKHVRVTLASSRRVRANHFRMDVPQPDDTAVDMLTFAMSGPGIMAFGLFFAISAIILFTNFEILPKRRETRRDNPFFMRISLNKSISVEFPDGVVRRLSKGESIFRFPSREACEAVARSLQKVPSRYVIYRLDGVSVKTLSTWPFEVNVSKKAWPSDESTDQSSTDKSTPARLWDEYERIGAIGKLDEQWSAFMKKMAGPVFADSESASCKLCGGTGFTRCFRCGGAAGASPIEGSSFTCDCQQGRRPCEWCAQQQS